MTFAIDENTYSLAKKSLIQTSRLDVPRVIHNVRHSVVGFLDANGATPDIRRWVLGDIVEMLLVKESLRVSQETAYYELESLEARHDFMAKKLSDYLLGNLFGNNRCASR